MKKNKNKKSFLRHGMGIRARLVMCFTCFVLFMLLVVWGGQLFLIDNLYQYTKTKELNKAAVAIAKAVGTEEEEQTAYSYSIRCRICVRMFSVENNELSSERISVENSSICIIHHMPNEALELYYSKAVENGGKYTFDYSSSKGDISDKKQGKNNKNPIADPKTDGLGNQDVPGNISQILSVRVIEGQDGNTYALFLDTEYAPLVSTTSTVSKVFLSISVFTVIFAAVLALIFANIVSKPLERMNKAARAMAETGVYKPDFKLEGYRETRELADTLNYVATEVNKADQLKQELIANVSHDLRTPLTMISGYAEVMRDIPGENTPENTQVIIDEAKHLTNLVNDMLDLSKLEAGAVEAKKEVFDITEMISEVIERFSAFTKHNGFDISFEPDRHVYVAADRKMITQVVYNLISNALNYTGEDKNVIVSQLADSEKSIVRISVSDSGEGIPQDKLALIWDRYYKIDKTHKRASVGSGVGLSIVKKALQLHGASFGVDSTVGVGSTFWFELNTTQNE